MLTPQEVASTTFPKAGLASGGYKMSSVDEFLDALTEDYKTLYAENITLKAKLKILAEKAEEYRQTENAMRATLLNAQQTAEKMIQEAEQKKATVVEEARKEADEAITEIESETKKVQAKLEFAKKELNDFIDQGISLCQQQIVSFQKLPRTEVNVVPGTFVTEEAHVVIPTATEEAQAPEEKVDVSMDATTIYDSPFVEKLEQAKEIYLGRHVSDKEVAEEIGQNVEEVMKEPEVKEEKKDGPGEFTKSLEELQWQFGKSFDITKD